MSQAKHSIEQDPRWAAVVARDVTKAFRAGREWVEILHSVTLTVDFGEMVAVMGPSVVALEQGYGGRLAVWGLTAGSLLFVPAALEGLVNARFPSGSPSGRWGRAVDRAIVAGIAVGVASGVLGNSGVRAIYPDGPPGGVTRDTCATPSATV